MPLRQVTTAQADYNEITVAGTGKALSIIASRTDMTMPSELYNVNPQTGEATMITNTNPQTHGVRLKKEHRRPSAW
jgi:hypothetical protein